MDSMLNFDNNMSVFIQILWFDTPQSTLRVFVLLKTTPVQHTAMSNLDTCTNSMDSNVEI